MEKSSNFNSKLVKRITRYSFAMLGLLTMLSYGFITFLLLCNNSSSKDSDACLKNPTFIIISLIVIIALHGLAFWRIFHFVKQYYNKLLGIIDVKDEALLRKRIKMDILGKVCLCIADMIRSSSDEKATNTLQEILKEMLEQLSEISKEKNNNSNVDKILLVNGDTIRQFTMQPQDAKGR